MPDAIEVKQGTATHEARPEASEEAGARLRPPLMAQSFLAALPIVLTVGLGFVANYYQSVRQHNEQLTVLKEQGELDRRKQELLAQDAQRARQAEADRAFTLQYRDSKAQSERQDREFAANAAAAIRQAAEQQLTLRIQNAAQREQQALEFTQSLERQRQQAEVEIIMKAGEVPTSLSAEEQDRQRARNLLWYADAGYIRLSPDIQAKLRGAANLEAGQSVPLPVTQSSGATAAIMASQRALSIPADGIVGAQTCTKAFYTEKATPGSVDPQLLEMCHQRFPNK